MTEDWAIARHDYAARVGLQSLQMLLVATRAADRTMREELYACAERLSRHAQWLGGAAPALAADAA